MEINLLIVLIIGCAGFVRGAVGFGDALVAMPLLAFVIPTVSSAPLMALSAMLMAGVLLVKEWKHLEFRPAALLTVCAMAGVPVGNMILAMGNERIIKALLGVIVFLFAIWSIKRPTRMLLKSNHSAPLFGLISGVLGGAYNIAGPPLVVYSTLRSWSPAQFRSMMQAYCIVGSVWVVSFHAASGRVTKFVLMHFVVTLPVLILATIAGQRLTRNMNKERFTVWVNICLLLSSVALLASCLSNS